MAKRKFKNLPKRSKRAAFAKMRKNGKLWRKNPKNKKRQYIMGTKKKKGRRKKKK